LGGGALAVLLPPSLRRSGAFPIGEGAPRALAAQSYLRSLPIPRVLRGNDLRIPIRETEVQILPGQKTRMWTYDGTFPGPTIRRKSGKPTRVTFEHQLPKKVGELTVHLHGGHSRSRFDGQPGGLTKDHPFSRWCGSIPRNLSDRQSGNGYLIKPGRRKTYLYDLTEDGKPERSAFQWYHDHRLDHTARNVWHGLAGMWILDDEFDKSLPLPSSDRDIPMMIVDRSFDRHNQLTDPFTTRLPPTDGVLGQYVLVNGAHLPFHRVSGQRYRLRFLNASQFRSYNLFLSNGAKLVQIASDSGLMPKPVRRNEVLIGPAERVEVVVDFAAAAGKSVELRSGPRHDGVHALGSRPFIGPLMQFQVGPRVPDGTRIPKRLRPLPHWTRRAKKKPDRRWVITIGGAFKPIWQINDRTFNPAHSQAFPELGTVETWEITNRTAVSHMIHMHSTDWYMLARDGKPPKPWEDCLKETFFLNPHETILVAAHFTDFSGKFVIHCHMLDHEDHGLMAQFEVVRPGKAPPLSTQVSAIPPAAPPPATA
jgi:spore coat protein A, manganese oxidase